MSSETELTPDLCQMGAVTERNPIPHTEPREKSVMNAHPNWEAYPTPPITVRALMKDANMVPTPSTSPSERSAVAKSARERICRQPHTPMPKTAAR